MKPPALLMRMLALAMLAGSLAGCLEVDQHPSWRDGAYSGKRDDRAARAHFVGDRLSWNAAISDRNGKQNEYRRMP